MQADRLVQTATSKPPISMQDATPWARNFESQWKRLRSVSAEHMVNLSGKLDAAQSPKDELVAILQNLVNMLPRAVKMLQDAGGFIQKALRDAVLVLPRAVVIRVAPR